MSSDGKDSKAAPSTGAAAAAEADLLKHRVCVSVGSLADSEVKSSLGLRFATDVPPLAPTAQPKVVIKISHKPNAPVMDLYKVKGQLQLLLGFAQLPEMAIDLDKTTKQFVISFVPPMLDALPLPIPLHLIAEYIQPFAAQLKALSVKLELSAAVTSFLPIHEKKKPAAATGTAAPAPAPATDATAAAAADPSVPLVDTLSARVAVDVQATRALVANALDAVGMPPIEAGYDVAHFLGGVVEQTEVSVRLASLRTVIEQWTIPLPPSFWAEHKAIAAAVAARKGKPARHMIASVIAKVADPKYAEAVKLQRLTQRRVDAEKASAAAAAAVAAATAAAAGGTAPAPAAAAESAGLAAAQAALNALPKLKQFLQWKALDGTVYYVRISDSADGKSRAGEVVAEAPAADDFVAFPSDTRDKLLPAAVRDYIEPALHLLWFGAADAKARIQKGYAKGVATACAFIPAEAKRVVAGLAQKADDTLLALDAVQFALPGGVGLSLDFTGLVDFRVVPWDVVQAALK